MTQKILICLMILFSIQTPSASLFTLNTTHTYQAFAQQIFTAMALSPTPSSSSLAYNLALATPQNSLILTSTANPAQYQLLNPLPQPSLSYIHNMIWCATGTSQQEYGENLLIATREIVTVLDLKTLRNVYTIVGKGIERVAYGIREIKSLINSDNDNDNDKDNQQKQIAIIVLCSQQGYQVWQNGVPSWTWPWKSGCEAMSLDRGAGYFYYFDQGVRYIVNLQTRELFLNRTVGMGFIDMATSKKKDYEDISVAVGNDGYLTVWDDYNMLVNYIGKEGGGGYYKIGGISFAGDDQQWLIGYSTSIRDLSQQPSSSLIIHKASYGDNITEWPISQTLQLQSNTLLIAFKSSQRTLVTLTTASTSTSSFSSKVSIYIFQYPPMSTLQLIIIILVGVVVVGVIINFCRKGCPSNGGWSGGSTGRDWNGDQGFIDHGHIHHDHGTNQGFNGGGQHHRNDHTGNNHNSNNHNNNNHHHNDHSSSNGGFNSNNHVRHEH